MLERTSRRVQIRALMVDDEIGQASTAGRAAHALIEELTSRDIGVVEAASAEDGHAVDLLRLGDSRRPPRLGPGWRQGSRRRHRPASPGPVAQRQDPDLSDGGAGRGRIHSHRCDGDGGRVHLDAAGHRGVHRRAGRSGDPALRPGGDPADGAGRLSTSPGSTNTPGTPRVTPAAPRFSSLRWDGSSTSSTGRTCSAPTFQSASAQLGSLLDHTGPIGAHERYAARVFGSHRTYCVTNGTSTSNRVIFHAAVGRGQIALCDRNCHKSIEHGLVMTGRGAQLPGPAQEPLRTHRPDSSRQAHQGGPGRPDQEEPAGDEADRPPAGACRHHQLDVRRPLLQREAGGGAARSHRGPDPFRRGLVRLRPVQSDLPGPARDVGRPGRPRPQGTDALRRPFHPQAPGGAVAGFPAPHA